MVETTQETLVKEISWDELEAAQKTGDGQRYFKPEVNVRYDIVIANATPIEKTFAGKTTPTKMLEMQLSSINGTATSMIWSSGSWKVMKEIMRHHKAGTLSKTKFLVRKTMQNGKQEYTFEEIGVAGGSPASLDDIGSFL